MLFCVWAGGWWFAGLTAAAGLGLGMEWTAMCGFNVRVFPGWALPLGAAIVAILAATGEPRDAFLCAVAGAAIAAVWTAPILGATDRPHRFALVLGFPYICLAALALPWLRADPAVGWANTLFVLVVVWSSDIGAYAFGRLFGGPKLAPAISPGKTWSGAVGGLISAALGAFAIAACFSLEFSSSHVLVASVGLGVVSQTGDLLESAAKRHFGVKDSGHLIPGLGVLLDRLDALIMVAPAAALIAYSVGRGVVLWR